jgi:hypothetical protein
VTCERGANACRKAFAKGEADRNTHPLRTGEYKLREYRDGLARITKTLDAIAADGLGSVHSPSRSFGCCTSDDVDLWLKGLSVALARNMAHDLLPAVAALQGDRVCARTVDVCVRHAEARARRLLGQCEMVHTLLKGGTGRDYAMVLPLVEEAARLADQLLKLAHVYRSGSKRAFS